MVHVTLVAWHRQGCGAMRFEFREIVVVRTHYPKKPPSGINQRDGRKRVNTECLER